MTEQFLNNYSNLYKKLSPIPSYSNFYKQSNDILHFKLPNHGLHLNINRQTSQYTASSFSISNDSSIYFSLAHLYNSQNDKFVTFGKLYYPTKVLNSMIIYKLKPNLNLNLKIYSNLYSKSYISIILSNINEKKASNNEWIFISNDKILGHRYLKQFKTNTNSTSTKNTIANTTSMITIGYEVWCSLSSFAPSISLGIKHDTPNNCFSLGLNPLFGRISSSYTANIFDIFSLYNGNKINPSIAKAGIRYVYNLYSMESKLELGIINDQLKLSINNNEIKLLFKKFYFNNKDWNFKIGFRIDKNGDWKNYLGCEFTYDNNDLSASKDMESIQPKEYFPTQISKSVDNNNKISSVRGNLHSKSASYDDSKLDLTEKKLSQIIK
ncbi:hypothetical protein TBLA_0E02160 [Henningerozyma blattae CBS 6284]|uniref:Mitochondrial distribution and morphology protein 10 n=1 Tax=Henningerozyma blattae (strain ATCC 34711 / CBS 6284 / DSM 70876 / NBRC 10599 / NRRL Y-10934 / UCD 77-7) TaxID=1071380 RepID=I2H4G7_HENB6|nr:hypothetical protein TBLA_0E02160 [Tetrapisispora blattae CBS 6284]CCH61269.1 hypothetical protein TBLA_0E02160 [Tetrapisispora blattae CBS 6284]